MQCCPPTYHIPTLADVSQRRSNGWQRIIEADTTSLALRLTLGEAVLAIGSW